MGFYGNITNNSRTQFQFDKIYPNRVSMELSKWDDGVYPGRYVLIEYGSSENHFKTIYLYDGKPYAGLKAIDYNDPSTGGITKIYIQPDVELEYKVVNREKYESTNDSELIIYSDEIVKVPSKQRIFNINKNPRYIGALNISTNDYMNSTEEEYLSGLDSLQGFLELDDEKFSTAKWDQKTEIYLINGIVIAPGYNDLVSTKYDLNNIVWKINTQSEYRVNDYNQYFQIDTSTATEDENGVYTNAIFNVVTGTGGSTDYINNFNLDRLEYDTARGYDSTVWQKTYVNEKETYVMVAELNSVVPTFDIVNDAPTLIPLTPHFDGNSTNVYYRLHWQPSWAIRTKAASPYLRGQRISQQGIFEEGASLELTQDGINYPSDQDTSWTGQFYNTLTNSVITKSYSPYTSKWETIDRDNNNDELFTIPAAIYYNRKGFNPEEVSYSEFITTSFEEPDADNPQYNGAIKASGWSPFEDRIGFFPTGLSGHMYNNHDDSLEGEAQVDTQEFVCMLPSIGNAIASVWDMVYGGRNTNDTIRKSLKRNLETGWEDGKEIPLRRGLRLRGYEDGYQVGEVNTLVGAINSVHDLMGMIITSLDGKKEDAEKNITSLSTDRIYFLKDDNDYYRKQLQYTYNEIKPKEGQTAQEAYEEAKKNVFKEITNLRDFDKTILKAADGSYNHVFFQDFNNRVDGTDASKYDYIQETSYHPNRLYFSLDEDNIEAFTGKQDDRNKLSTYISNCYFYQQRDENNNKLILDTNPEAGPYTYYEFEDYGEKGYKSKFNEYTKIKHLPTDYAIVAENTSRDEVTGEIKVGYMADNIHGIYKPNTYYYQRINQETGEIGYVLDSNPTKTRNVYFTINSSEAIPPDENSYRLLITYEPYLPTSEEQEDLPAGVYYYFPSLGTPEDLTLENIKSGKLNGFAPLLAINSYGDIQEAAKQFEEEGKSYFIFKKLEQYVQNKEPSYAIELKPIFLENFQESAIFKPIFDNTLSGQLIGLEFIKEQDIPITTWENRPDENGNLTPTLVLQHPETQEVYEGENALYILGFTKESNDAAAAIKLMSLSDIKPTSNHHLIPCEGSFYQSGTYHYKPTDENTPLNQSYLLDTSTTGQYKDYEFIDYYKINPENIYLTPNTFKVNETTVKYIKGVDYLKKNYYYKVGTLYKPVVAEPAENTILYTVTPADDFYEPNKYYIKDAGTDEENLANNHYTMAQTSSKPSGTLYKKEGIYVTNDPYGVYPYGTEWNLDCKIVPPHLTLATRSDKYGLIKIPNLARTDNTIHGLILRINQILEAGNTGIRDNSTVQGALNRLNDIVARIDKMKSGQFIIVDEYGRMHSADYSTAQEYVAINYGNNTITEYKNTQADTTIEDDRWIDLDITPTYSEPKFTIKHNFTAVTSTTTSADLNDNTAGDGNNKGKADKLELYTPIVDNTGHVVGKNIETVTLPYGYKHYKTAGAVDTADADIYTEITTVESGANTSETIGVAESKTQASKTQDELTVIPVNKWIQTKFEEDALKIAHEIHAINTEAKSSNLNNSDNFIVQDLEFDTAGHVIKNQARTYTLPYNFKTFAISNLTVTDAPTAAAADIVADTQVDTLNLSSSNRWIVLNANVDTDTLTIGHAHAGSDTGRLYGDSESQTPKFGATFQVPYFGVDEAGHIQTKSAHTVTIPKPSLTKGTGNVVTGLSLDPETGAFTETKANVGTLPITDFDPNITASVLQVTDSINTALAKLQSRIANNEKTITDLDVTDTAVADQYVSSVTQADGKITVNRASLTDALNNTYAPLAGSINTSSEFSYEIGATDDASKTIEWLFKKVADLEAEIEVLKSV